MQVKLRRVLALSLLGSLFLTTVYILGWSNFFDIEKIEIKTSDESNRTLIANRLTDSDLGLEIGDPMARVQCPCDKQSFARRSMDRTELKLTLSGSLDLSPSESAKEVR